MPIVGVLRFILNHPLTRQNRLAAVGRFLRWQIDTIVLKRPVIVDFVSSSKLVVTRGMAGATGNVYCGLHEFEDMAFVLHCLRKGDLFCDVGANVGSYTVLASAVVGARSLSFEPVPSTFERLLDNINVNRIVPLVKPMNIGLGSESGTLRFTAGQDTINRVLFEGEDWQDAVLVEVAKLDDVVEDAPALIKIDVEGYESQVLAGAQDTLKDSRLLAVLVELKGHGEKYGCQEDAVHGDLLRIGFRTCAYDPFERELSVTDDRNREGNTLYVRDYESVAKRLKEAPPFTVIGRTI